MPFLVQYVVFPGSVEFGLGIKEFPTGPLKCNLSNIKILKQADKLKYISGHCHKPIRGYGFLKSLARCGEKMICMYTNRRLLQWTYYMPAKGLVMQREEGHFRRR